MIPRKNFCETVGNSSALNLIPPSEACFKPFRQDHFFLGFGMSWKQCFDSSCAISNIFQFIMDKVTICLDFMNNFISFIALTLWLLSCYDFNYVSISLWLILLTSDLVWVEESKDYLTSWDQGAFLEPTWNILKGLFSSVSSPCSYIIFNISLFRYHIST